MFAHFTVELVNYMVAFIVSHSTACRGGGRREWEGDIYSALELFIWTVEMCRCSPFLVSFFFFFLNGRMSAASLALTAHIDSTKDRIIPSAANTFRHDGNLLIGSPNCSQQCAVSPDDFRWRFIMFIRFIGVATFLL